MILFSLWNYTWDLNTNSSSPVRNYHLGVQSESIEKFNGDPMFFRWPNVFKLQETQTICWKVYSFYRDIILMLKEDLKIKDEGLQWKRWGIRTIMMASSSTPLTYFCKRMNKNAEPIFIIILTLSHKKHTEKYWKIPLCCKGY